MRDKPGERHYGAQLMNPPKRAKHLINRVLRPFGMKLEGLTEERNEASRLGALEAAGYFDRPAFPIPAAFDRKALDDLLPRLSECNPRFERFHDPRQNAVGYTFD